MESLKAALLLKESYARMPADAEFRREFVVKDVYNFRSRNYLLRKLENFDRKEPVDVDSYTIEHVMPQNPDLSPEWQQELGPDWKTVQERWLHTIGNLTLTGYNPELSDRPFSEKLTIKGGFRDSPLRLNQYLAKLDHWNEEEIEKRAELLADLALQDLAGADAPRGDAREVPQDEGQGRRRLHARRPRRARRARSGRSSTSSAGASPTSTPASARRCASSTSPTSCRRTSSRSSRWRAS